MTLKFDGWPQKIIGHLFYITSSFVYHLKPLHEFKLELLSRNAQFGSKSVIFFVPCDIEIWLMTLKNNRAPFYTTLSFVRHFKPIGEFKLKLQSGNAQFESKSTIFLAVWPRNFTDDVSWKTIGHLFYATWSFVHHFVAFGEFKLELQSGNAQFGSNSTIFSRVTLKFDGWPSKTIGHLFYVTSSFVHHFVAIGEFKLELQSGNAQSGSNTTIFRAVWPWNLTDDLVKQ